MFFFFLDLVSLINYKKMMTLMKLMDASHTVYLQGWIFGSL